MTDPGPVITSLSHGSLAAPGGDCAARRLSVARIGYGVMERQRQWTDPTKAHALLRSIVAGGPVPLQNQSHGV
jgi:hypothetical protein